MKKLKITIEGAAATGKTTVAILLMEALRAAGFDGVVFDDDDVCNDRTPETQARCLADLRGTFVEVQTQMAPKEPEAPHEEPSWSPRRPGTEALVSTAWDGSVRGRGQLTVRELHDANFVAMVDPEDDGDTGVVSKCRYGFYPPGTVLTHEHLADLALAYSAVTYAHDHVFFEGDENPLRPGPAHARYEAFVNDLVRACREPADDRRRAALASLLASIL